MDKKVSHRKSRVGVVVSDKMDKTVTVLVERLVLHPKYRKYVRRRKKFKAHDEKNLCRTGDKVLIEETRPLSKTKRWRVVRILQRLSTGTDDSA
ncbi:MAG TPA: 30S ribosomal protein S17 [Thermodesulforhabdus norvegica]|uniref:Small ribosomal subunit protein uS17 n=1 Tax=Thermodesulforhabdus norvegica TaxID=39841 RepID=A0A7C1B193_9BACT|nr:30S ribosomal protein S17 [Deltaproteobacteria bacterium]MBW2068347.1 30S ribosomal protein S17 [Deltaproteobacteria bacterium]HDL89841.1 30S ribosomal protein S17 [Thermodesulforhabdus norvegica]